jgi:DNA polymerase-3 subunit beta
MKFVVSKKALVDILAGVAGMVEKRNTVPVLNNVLIIAKAGRLTIKATDLEREASNSTEAVTEVEGAITAPAQQLADIAKRCRDGDVLFSLEPLENTEGHRLLIRSGRSVFNLQTLPADIFPETSANTSGSSFTMQVAELVRLLKTVKFAMASTESHWMMEGVLVHPHKYEDGRAVLRAVATETHRLCFAEADLPKGASNLEAFVVPKKTVNELVKVLGSVGDVAIIADSTKVIVRHGTMQIISKLLDNKFPNYIRVLDIVREHQTMVLTMPSKELLESARRATIVQNDMTRGVLVSVHPGEIHLLATGGDGSNAADVVACTYEGPEHEFALDGSYLISMIEQMQGNAKMLLTSDAKKSIMFEDDGDAGTVYMVQPQVFAKK